MGVVLLISWPSQALFLSPKFANPASLDSSSSSSSSSFSSASLAKAPTFSSHRRCRAFHHCWDAESLCMHEKEEEEEEGIRLGISSRRRWKTAANGSSTGRTRTRTRRVLDSGKNLVPAAAAAMGDVLDSGENLDPVVGIIMGSDSDLPIMKSAAEILEFFGVAYELTVVSAHRTPERMVTYAQTAHRRGLRVIIAGAGGAAHLPGMVASLTPLPVIGVPVKGSATDGLDSLLSIVQMPRGIPVATVAIQNATNAGLLAVRMLGLSCPELVHKMLDYQNGLKDMVLEKAEKLEHLGWQEYTSSNK